MGLVIVLHFFNNRRIYSFPITKFFFFVCFWPQTPKLKSECPSVRVFYWKSCTLIFMYSKKPVRVIIVMATKQNQTTPLGLVL